MSETKRQLAFINIAHFADHYVLLIFPTVVIGMHRPRALSRSACSRCRRAGSAITGAAET
jgi:hypothetical protein